MSIIEPKSALAFEQRAGSRFKVTDLDGHQVGDMVIFSLRDYRERFSQASTRKLNKTVTCGKGTSLLSNRCRPLLKIVEDTVGVHDIVSSACCSYDYPIRFGVTDHESCLHLLTSALEPYGIEEHMIPDPFNVFMQTDVAEDGSLKLQVAPSGPGDFAEFEAQQDVLVALTSCPQDLNETNDYHLTRLQVDSL